MNAQHPRLRGLLVGSIFLVLAGAFLAWRLGLPSDGARLEPGVPAWKANGVMVTPLQQGPLQPGDVVVAVAGRSLQAWAEGLFQPTLAPLAPNQPLDYTVIRDTQPVRLAIPPVPFPLQAVLARNWSAILFTFFTQAVMTFVFLLKPRDRPARALFIWAFSLSHTYAWSIGLQVSDLVNSMGYWLFQVSASGAWLVFWSAGLEFAMIFPRPHPLIEKRPWIIRLVYAGSFLLFGLYLALTRLASATTLDWLGTWTAGNWLVAVVFQILTAYFVLDSYRSMHDRAAHQKIRWIVYAFVLCGSIGLGLWFVPGLVLGHPLIDANGLGLSLLPFPVILAIAVLRYQLFDIDVILHRTLIYTLLTATLLLIYLGSVIVLQQVFRALTGQQSDVAIIISTLAIAALFNPLRQRIQATVDRRFYRRKYDAAQVLAAFGATVRDEVDLNLLTDELLNVVQETIQPTQMQLWLKPPEPKQKG